MKTVVITIILQQDDDGRMALDHAIAGGVAPKVAANACRATADKIDREWIRTELQAETAQEVSEGDTDD
jgi:hypothetical protein